MTEDAPIKLVIAALTSGMIALVSLLHNLLEDNTEAVPTVGKVPGT